MKKALFKGPFLIYEFVFEDTVDRTETILPTDLLTFLIGAAIIGDTNFIDPYLWHFGQFCSDLRLNSKSSLFDRDLLCD